jgi:hypothetical protein
MARLLIVAGVILIAAGLAWSWLARLGLGHLPGDILIRRGHTSFYFPVVTCIIVSAMMSLVFWLLHK